MAKDIDEVELQEVSRAPCVRAGLSLAAFWLAACGGGDSLQTPPPDADSSVGAGDVAASDSDISDGGVDSGDSASDASNTSDANGDATRDAAGDSASTDAALDGGAIIPIHHVIVIVKESHTFDNYFGSFPGAEGIAQCQLMSSTIPCPHAPDRTLRDLCSSHDCAITDWNGGQMNGWESVSGSTQLGDHLAWAQYQEADIPNYWAYARHFALGDHFFANELGPSFPGHMFTLAAQAGWAYSNPSTNILSPYWGCDEAAGSTVTSLDKGTCVAKDVFPCFKIPSVPDVLPASASWKFYGTNFSVLSENWSMFDAIDSIRNGAGWKNVVNVTQFNQTSSTIPSPLCRGSWLKISPTSTLLSAVFAMARTGRSVT